MAGGENACLGYMFTGIASSKSRHSYYVSRYLMENLLYMSLYMDNWLERYSCFPQRERPRKYL